MKKWIFVLCFIIIGSFSIPDTSTIAQQRRDLRDSFWRDARGIWRGKYSPDDISLWEKRLKKSKSWKNRLNVAICHTTIGRIFQFEGEFEKALSHYNQSLELSKKHDYGKLLAFNYHFMGQVLIFQGRFDEALKSYNNALQNAKSEDMDGLVANIFREMSEVLIQRGKFKQALKHASRVLEMAEERQDGVLLMRFNYVLGTIHQKQGNFEKAKEYLNRSLKKSREINHKKYTGRILNGIGDNCFSQGDYECALKAYQESLSIYEEENFKIGLAGAYNKMGRISFKNENKEKALKYFNKSRELADDMGMRGLLASSLKNLGVLYGEKNNFDDALKETEGAINILKEVDIPAELQTLYYMKGSFLEKKGDMTGAEKSYKESVEILDSLREGLTGGEEQKMAFVEKRGEVYKKLIKLLLKQGKSAEGLKYMERSKMKKLRDQFDRMRPEFSNEEEKKASEKEREMREQIEETREQLADEKSKPKEEQDTKKITKLEKALNVKKQDYIEHINDLREKFPDLASLLSIQPDTLLDLQELLPAQVAIVQYLIMDDQIYIFVVTKDTLSYKEVKISQADLDGKIEYFRSLLMNPQIPRNMGPLQVKTLKPVEESRSGLYDMFITPFLQSSEDLYDLLLKPVEAELAKFSVLGLIPNGKLHLLPFQALGKKDPEGNFRFILEDKSIFQLNSQSILKFAQKKAKAIGSKGRLIAFGNPDNSLKYAEEEIRLIKGIFAHSQTYIRKDASEDKVKKRLKEFDILHFATHGILKGKIKESYILLSPSPDGKEDGKLFLREIWGLPLRGYQLVTLSACETAKGKEASGDVMVSLETAFLRAGTPAIMASLWAVDDRATGLLMKTFYDKLIVHGKAEALREAQLALMKDPQFAYPYFWAPFILVGDWR